MGFIKRLVEGEKKRRERVTEAVNKDILSRLSQVSNEDLRSALDDVERFNQLPEDEREKIGRKDQKELDRIYKREWEKKSKELSD